MPEHQSIDGITIRAIRFLDYFRIVFTYLMVLAFFGIAVSVEYLKGNSALPVNAWIVVFASTTLLFSRGLFVFFPRTITIDGKKRPILHWSATILDRTFYRWEHREGSRQVKFWVVGDRRDGN